MPGSEGAGQKNREVESLNQAACPADSMTLGS